MSAAITAILLKSGLPSDPFAREELFILAGGLETFGEWCEVAVTRAKQEDYMDWYRSRMK